MPLTSLVPSMMHRTPCWGLGMRPNHYYTIPTFLIRQLSSSSVGLLIQEVFSLSVSILSSLHSHHCISARRMHTITATNCNIKSKYEYAWNYCSSVPHLIITWKEGGRVDGRITCAKPAYSLLTLMWPSPMQFSLCSQPLIPVLLSLSHSPLPSPCSLLVPWWCLPPQSWLSQMLAASPPVCMCV